MSPVLFTRGFTRDFIDGKVKEKDLQSKIEESYKTISKSSDATVIEGTGHVGVGSIVNFSNARCCVPPWTAHDSRCLWRPWILL